MNKPKNICEGMSKGVICLSKGVYSGVTGLCKQPYNQIKKDGTHGIFKGIAKGISGLFIKPIAGIFDGTSMNIEGLI